MSENDNKVTPTTSTVGGERANRLPLKLLLATIGMFGFGFALVPLYDVLCDITGLNGKTGGRYEYDAAIAEVDSERLVTVQFMTSNNADMSWEFRSKMRQIEVHPGELNEVMFYARNPSKEVMIAQAVPSVSPSEAADYLHKTECFCFNQQELKAGEAIDMPLQFFIDQDIPEEVTKLTLSYSLFDITQNFRTTSL